MTINQQKNGTELVIKVEGRLDTTTAPELDAVVGSELDDITALTFDFEGLDYISSAGLRVILVAIKKMNKQGTLEIVNANELVKEVFDVTGFADMVTIK